jgi:hypothetical protein
MQDDDFLSRIHEFDRLEIPAVMVPEGTSLEQAASRMGIQDPVEIPFQTGDGGPVFGDGFTENMTCVFRSDTPEDPDGYRDASEVLNELADTRTTQREATIRPSGVQRVVNRPPGPLGKSFAPVRARGGADGSADALNNPLHPTGRSGQEPQDTRSPDQTLQFYVALHSAAFPGDPFFYGAIWIVNSNTHSGGVTTLGGQPVPASTSTGFALVGNSNFPGDRKINDNSQLLPIQVPSGQSPSQFAANLRAAAASYSNNQAYSLFPGITPQTAYNSNSFVSGVIQAAGGNAPRTDPFSTPGYDIPLPLALPNLGQGSSQTSSPHGSGGNSQ